MSVSAPTGLVTAKQFAEMSFDGPVEMMHGEIVDAEARTVETFRCDVPSVHLHEPHLLTNRELPEFSVPVSELFAGVE